MEPKVVTNDVTITNANKGIEIPATLTMPETCTEIVIFSHGIMGDRSEYLDTQTRIAELLSQNNVASLRIDHRGHGESKAPLSDYCIRTQVEDLEEAFHWVKQVLEIDKISLFGTSFGAAASVICGVKYSSTISKVVLLAPTLDMEATFLNPSTSWGRQYFGAANIKSGLNAGGIKLADNYRLATDALIDISMLNLPKLLSLSRELSIIIFHGDKDDMVPLSASLSVSNAHDNIHLIVMANTEHGLTEVGDETFSSHQSLKNIQNVVNRILQD